MSSAGQLLIAGRIPGERIQTTVITADSATFTTTEIVVATGTAAPLVAGRIYMVVFDAGFQTTVDGILRVMIREDNLAGTSIQIRDFFIDNTGTASAARVEVEFEAQATGNKVFVATGDMLSGGGTANLNASGTLPSYLYVDYVRG
ncbi:MAG TPA: hypothetical protein VF062_06495 [Candidatus Limnocylindrales bacterium]